MIVMLILLKIIMWLIIIGVVLYILVGCFLKFHPTFGGKPDQTTQQRILNSPNYNGKQFVNLSYPNLKQVTLMPDKNVPIHHQSTLGLISNFMFPPPDKHPDKPIVTEPMKFEHKALQSEEFVWLGHSTVLFKLDELTFITDPVFHRASPVPVACKPYSMTNPPNVQDLPFIDVVLISHDHYDHLDYLAIKEMRQKVGMFLVPLGVKSHLIKWGISQEKINEYDWYEDINIESIRLTFAPTYHYSGRGIRNHSQTLWGSWVVESKDLSVYFSGDGGYSGEFEKIGQKFGGFDIAFIEDGAYHQNWSHKHMKPEESAQAAIDLNAKVVLPIHWGKFDLSTHSWTDPVKRIKFAMNQYNDAVGEKQKIKIATPRIGQVFRIDNLPIDEWWQ